MRGSANHHANPQEKCSQMEAPDGNNKRNTHTQLFLCVFLFLLLCEFVPWHRLVTPEVGDVLRIGRACSVACV